MEKVHAGAHIIPAYLYAYHVGNKVLWKEIIYFW